MWTALKFLLKDLNLPRLSFRLVSKHPVRASWNPIFQLPQNRGSQFKSEGVMKTGRGKKMGKRKRYSF